MQSALSHPDFSIDEFLAREHGKDLLRFSTAGSVDDGKSTLIGRLLYDSRSVYEDQIQSVTKASKNRSAGTIDFSLLTDGLRAEREQGITIDVAYRYFATARRKFIIADTPGHEQYTRNMATGASTADLAIILVDARNGVLMQSRRHAYIAALLGIPQFVIAINKMDLAAYEQRVFEDIKEEFSSFLGRLGIRNNYFVPISALNGDNIVDRSRNMRWFGGPSLLEYLETVDLPVERKQSFRLPVQLVLRPDQDFRGYAGQIASGAVRPGDEVLALPSGRRTRVKRLASFDGDLQVAHAPMSVTVVLEDEIDISRGDLLCSAVEPAEAARAFETKLVWFDAEPLEIGKSYFLKHTTQTVRAEVTHLHYGVDIRTLTENPVETLAMNGIGMARIETSKALFFDSYASNRGTGSFILIDPETNGTVAAGTLLSAVRISRNSREDAGAVLEPVTAGERLARYGHNGAIIPVQAHVVRELERRLFDRGCAPVVLNEEDANAATMLRDAGFLALLVQAGGSDNAAAIIGDLERNGTLVSQDWFSEGDGI